MYLMVGLRERELNLLPVDSLPVKGQDGLRRANSRGELHEPVHALSEQPSFHQDHAVDGTKPERKGMQEEEHELIECNYNT